MISSLPGSNLRVSFNHNTTCSRPESTTNLLTHLCIHINAAHCDAKYNCGFSDEWPRVQTVWIMHQAFLIVAHNFTDQWALSITGEKRGKKKSWICYRSKVNIPLPLFSEDVTFESPRNCQVPSVKCVCVLNDVFDIPPEWTVCVPQSSTQMESFPGRGPRPLVNLEAGSLCVKSFALIW